MGWVKLDSGVRVNLEDLAWFDATGVRVRGYDYDQNVRLGILTDADIARLDAVCGLNGPEIPEQYRR